MARSVLVLEFIERLSEAPLTSCGGQDYVGRSFTEGVILLEGGIGEPRNDDKQA